jgi:CHAT domain-containing protein/Tfp pilus assembly protein PilF
LSGAFQDADRSYRRYSEKSVEWGWRFRVLKAHILVLRGANDDALLLLNGILPPSLVHSDLPARQMLVRGLAQDYSQRLDEAEESLRIAEELAQSKQPQLLGDVASAQGTLYVHQKRYADARAAYYKALLAARAGKNAGQEAGVLSNLGFVSMWQERFDEAVDWFKASLVLSEALGARDTSSHALGNLGWSYRKLGDFENALTLYKQAEEASIRSGLVGRQIYWLTGISNVYYQQHDYGAAETILKQALDLARAHNDKGTLTEFLNDLAEISIETGQMDLAEKYADEAFAIEQAGLDQTGVLETQLVRGRIEENKHDFARAEESFRGLIQNPKADTSQKWEAEARLARVYADEGLAAKAENEFRRSLGTIEMARSSVRTEEFRLSFLSSAITFYSDYIEFLISRKRIEDALQVAELSRARTLAEGLASTTQAASLPPRNLRPQQVAQKLKASLLFYWIGQNDSYLWVITPGKTAYFKLPKASEIEPVVKSYRKALLGMRDAQDAGSSDGKQLYAILVEPAKKLIPKGSRVILFPAESLYGLNFETLVVPGPQPHFWIEDVTLTTASSLTLLGSSTVGTMGARRPAAKEKSLLLVGNTEQPNADFPALAQAPAEMDKIERYFPDPNRKVLKGKQATPTAYLSSNPERFAYLHFVTHGTASRTRPLESAVILSQEGDSFKLYARDIVQHRLNAKLVTISACNGSGTRAYSGEGLVGLSWAFLRAGAHNVIGALWEVSDASTPQLMDALYGGLSQGKDPATALRDAKLSLLHSADSNSVFKKPFYWAPFQLYAGS